MFGSKSTLILSISTDYSQLPSDTKYIHVQSRHKWTLSVRPHTHMMGSHKTERPIHYSPVWNSSDQAFEIRQFDIDEADVAANILLDENAHTTASSLQQTLQTGFATIPAAEVASSPASWVRKALHILQQERVLGMFDIGDLVAFGYQKTDFRIRGGETTREVVKWNGMRKAADEKKGWSVSYANQVPQTQGRGRGVYGGLM